MCTVVVVLSQLLKIGRFFSWVQWGVWAGLAVFFLHALLFCLGWDHLAALQAALAADMAILAQHANIAIAYWNHIRERADKRRAEGRETAAATRYVEGFEEANGSACLCSFLA